MDLAISYSDPRLWNIVTQGLISSYCWLHQFSHLLMFLTCSLLSVSFFKAKCEDLHWKNSHLECLLEFCYQNIYYYIKNFFFFLLFFYFILLLQLSFIVAAGLNYNKNENIFWCRSIHRDESSGHLSISQNILTFYSQFPPKYLHKQSYCC